MLTPRDETFRPGRRDEVSHARTLWMQVNLTENISFADVRPEQAQGVSQGRRSAGIAACLQIFGVRGRWDGDHGGPEKRAQGFCPRSPALLASAKHPDRHGGQAETGQDAAGKS